MLPGTIFCFYAPSAFASDHAISFHDTNLPFHERLVYHIIDCQTESPDRLLSAADRFARAVVALAQPVPCFVYNSVTPP